jgi:hypothetical protein
MALSSIEYKERMLEFDEDLSDVAADLYWATTEKPSGQKRAALVAAGKRKLAAFDALLTVVSPAQRPEVQKRFGDKITDIRGFLRTLEGGEA